MPDAEGIQALYADKKRILVRLQKDLLAGKYKNQPEPEDVLAENEEEGELPGIPGSLPSFVKQARWIYITSLRKREAQTTPNAVCLAPLELAAFRLADG